jgi:hypothetical protein
VVASRADYECQVRALAGWAKAELGTGRSVESVAREAVGRRNALKRQFRTDLPDDLLRLLELRNIRLYGDPVGPSADDLLLRYGSWEAVLAASARHARFEGR